LTVGLNQPGRTRTGERVNMRNFIIFSFIFLMGLLSSCSLFFGNIRSIEERSRQYFVDDLNRSRAEWKKQSATQDAESPDGARADLTYLSSRTSAVISLTSGCKSQTSEIRNLTEETRVLLLGISEIKFDVVRKKQVDQAEAFWSSVSGQMNHEPIQLEIVVFQKGNCTYDLTLVGSPTLSSDNQKDFAHFVSTFHFK